MVSGRARPSIHSRLRSRNAVLSFRACLQKNFVLMLFLNSILETFGAENHLKNSPDKHVFSECVLSHICTISNDFELQFGHLNRCKNDAGAPWGDRRISRSILSCFCSILGPKRHLKWSSEADFEIGGEFGGKGLNSMRFVAQSSRI